jgi:hypothetical protein
LVGLANEAGATRDYDQAGTLIELARRIKNLAEEFSRRSPSRSEPLGDSVDPRRDFRPTVGSSVVVRNRNRVGQYPRFLREGEYLIKIGWSKSGRAEYEHKSPKRLLAPLCEALTEVKGRRITMDKVLPLKDAVNGSVFPDYQTYVCLAWLKSVRLVIQHGRKGYSLPNGIELHKSIEAKWVNLPTR